MRGKIFFLAMLVIVPFLAPGLAPGESSTLEAQEQDSLRVMQIEDYARQALQKRRRRRQASRNGSAKRRSGPRQPG